jgi:hypothetical protein
MTGNLGLGAAFAMGAGVFAIVCAWRDFDWFMENYRARPVVRVFGRDGARRLYMFAGCALIVSGLFII